MQTKVEKNYFIADKVTDNIFVILSPLIALMVMFLFCEPRSKNGAFLYGSETPYLVPVIALLMTHSHVLLGFIRSHFNKSVFVRYKYRFTFVPIFLLAFMGTLPGSIVYIGFFGFYWDEWHSLMQTFGFGRVYDVKAGNNPLTGRKLDIGMSFVVGLLPFLILESYFPDSQKPLLFSEYPYLPSGFMSTYIDIFRALRWPFVIFGIGYTIYYTVCYWRLCKKGYVFSKTKFLLFLTTGVSSIIVARFYTLVDAGFFGNIYHAIQYYFIVFITERPNISKLSGIAINQNRKLISLYVLLILPLFIFFAAFRQMPASLPIISAFWLLTTLMHFWYDGFIWSVRRHDI